jgi:hypothetical protein
VEDDFFMTPSRFAPKKPTVNYYFAMCPKIAHGEEIVRRVPRKKHMRTITSLCAKNAPGEE